MVVGLHDRVPHEEQPHRVARRARHPPHATAMAQHLWERAHGAERNANLLVGMTRPAKDASEGSLPEWFRIPDGLGAAGARAFWRSIHSGM